MRIGELLWMMMGLFVVLVLAGVLVLAFCWLWRKIALPEGAPPPRWIDPREWRSGAGRAPVWLRLAVVALLGLLMSVPVNCIYDLIRERADNYRSVVRELAGSWGGPQVLIGPLLVIPYTIQYSITEEVPLTDRERAEAFRRDEARAAAPGAWVVEDGPAPRATKTVTRTVTQEKTVILLPEDLNITGRLEPELRTRGIYDVRVYTADLALSGSFAKPDLTARDARVATVHWDRARILVSLSDTKAFRNVSALALGGHDYRFVPGTENSAVAPTGFSADVDLSGAGERIPFDFTMAVGGSHGFFLAPVAVNSVFELASSWPHPKYAGDGLPTRREQSSSGFSATWDIPNLVRNYPQLAEIADLASQSQPSSPDSYQEDRPRPNLPLAEYLVGVELFEPVFHYSILTRAVKYAIMFIGLTFLSVLIFEIAAGRPNQSRLHLAQYGLIGLSLSLFYLVLLAASEQMTFTPAYLLAAGLNILMIGGYIRAALAGWKPALTVAGLLTALYATLFFILRMEDYSLVAGTTLLILALGALMMVTRHLGEGKNKERDV